MGIIARNVPFSVADNVGAAVTGWGDSSSPFDPAWVFVPEGNNANILISNPAEAYDNSPAIDTDERTVVFSYKPPASQASEPASRTEKIFSITWKTGGGEDIYIEATSSSAGGRFFTKDAGGNNVQSDFIDAADWYRDEGNHFMISFDAANDLGCWYVNGIKQTAVTDAGGANLYGLRGCLVIGAGVSNNSGYSSMNDRQLSGCSLREFWYADAYIDFDVQENRDKFYLDGFPVFQGNLGNASGVTPSIYLSGDADAWNQGLNKGTISNDFFQVAGKGFEHPANVNKISFRTMRTLDNFAVFGGGWNQITESPSGVTVGTQWPDLNADRLFAIVNGLSLTSMSREYGYWEGYRKDYTATDDGLGMVGQYLPYPPTLGDPPPAGRTFFLEEEAPIHFHLSGCYVSPSTSVRFTIYHDSSDYTKFTRWVVLGYGLGVGMNVLTFMPTDNESTPMPYISNGTTPVITCTTSNGGWQAKRGIARIEIEGMNMPTYYSGDVESPSYRGRGYEFNLLAITQGYGHTPTVINMSDDAQRTIDMGSITTTRTYPTLDGGNTSGMTLMEATCAMGVPFQVSVIAENVISGNGIDLDRMKIHHATGYMKYLTHGHFSLPSLCRMEFDYSQVDGVPFDDTENIKFDCTPEVEPGSVECGSLVRVVSTDTQAKTQVIVVSRKGIFANVVSGSNYTQLDYDLVSRENMSGGFPARGVITKGSINLNTAPEVEDIVQNLHRNYDFLIDEGFEATHARHYVYPLGGYRSADLIGQQYTESNGRTYYTSQKTMQRINEAFAAVGLVSARVVGGTWGAMCSGIIRNATNTTLNMQGINGHNLDLPKNIPDLNYENYRDVTLPNLHQRGGILYHTTHGVVAPDGDDSGETIMDINDYVDVLQYQRDAIAAGTIKVMTTDQFYRTYENVFGIHWETGLSRDTDYDVS